jgi:hypothetical protein
VSYGTFTSQAGLAQWWQMAARRAQAQLNIDLEDIMKSRLIRWITLLLLMAGAIAFYFSGLMLGVIALLIVAAVLELLFWGKLFFGDRQPR